MHGHDIGDTGDLIGSLPPEALLFAALVLFIAGIPIPVGYWPGKGVKWAVFCGGCSGVHVGYDDGDGRWLGEPKNPDSGGGDQ